MRFIGAAVVFLVPLALWPGRFFYYDITPKACLLYLGAALLAATAWMAAGRLRTAAGDAWGRWYLGLLFASIGIALAAAAVSPITQLAWQGSNWRRGGAVTEAAVLIAALLIALCPAIPTLRSLCAAGIIAASYGIGQYFGWDPWINRSAYEVGEGIYQIVRPPSTLGHSDYFAAFLLWSVFAGLGLWVSGASRKLGSAAVFTGVAAILLAGSRGAWLGALAGAAALVLVRRPSILRVGQVAVVAIAAFALFYISPAGERLRARAFWISEDRAGGARLLLWRDSLGLAAAHPLLGVGPDVYPAAFPPYQSRDLSRAYPDFAHESPHNMFLDALTGEGLGGFLVLASLAGLGLFAGWRHRAEPITAGLLAGLVATLVAQQFIVFVIPTALLFYLMVGLLVLRDVQAQPVGRAARIAVGVAGLLIAVAFSYAAHRVGSGDRAIQRAKLALASGDASEAISAFQNLTAHQATGVSANIELSRLADAAGSKAPLLPNKLLFSQMAAAAATAATKVPENGADAWYNLAVMLAQSNNIQGVEASLRQSIARAPRWYKPHWMLARVLAAAGQTKEARDEARLALDLGGNKHREVAGTLQPILNPGASPGKL